MTPQDFTYWLQGFIELQNPEKINKQQTQMIKDHLGLVFTKVTDTTEHPHRGFGPDSGYQYLTTGHTGIKSESLC